MVTQHQIAQAAGVNKTTVSKALTGSSDINRETAQRIRDIAIELGYKKKIKYIEKKSHFIGIIIPESNSTYYSSMVSKLSMLLVQKGYTPLFTITNFQGSFEIQHLDEFIENGFAGIICMTESDDISEKLKDSMREGRVPILQIGLNISSSEYDNIFVDEAMGIEFSMLHLKNLGHRRIAFIGDLHAKYRLKYFRKFMEENDMALPDEYVVISDKRHMQAGYECAKRLLACKELPTAIVADYDDIALGAIRRFAEEGIQVPDDLSIIGVDNAPYSPYLSKSLTTIDGHVDEMCEIAVRILLNKVESRKFGLIQNVSIKPELIIRETTKIRNK
jgi:LacI family transcriptional regulator